MSQSIEIQDLKKELKETTDTLMKANENLADKVVDLEIQLSEIKPLNSQEVLDILITEFGYDYGDKSLENKHNTKIHNAKNTILKLAYDKNKILKTLKRYTTKQFFTYLNGSTKWKDIEPESLAIEIIENLGGKE
jgi:FKBP-type peptidyl-prolyl cis-trans isomerase (trigger factor)